MINCKTLLLEKLFLKKKCWLITGVAGFIGSNILETLISNNQYVIGVDNFSTGKKKNILKYLNNKEKNFFLIKKDINNLNLNDFPKKKINFVIHLAALASVNESIRNPKKCYKNNVLGFKRLVSCIIKLKTIEKVIYTSSAAVYGNSSLKNSENSNLKPLSPYAHSKIQNEIMAEKYSKQSRIKFIGFRFFNIFGRNQNPNSQYSSVISKWVNKLKNKKKIEIFGDGYTSRDFCYVKNVVFFILVSFTKNFARHEIFNLACGKSITLNNLAKILIFHIKKKKSFLKFVKYKNFKKGDIYKSRSNISKIRKKIYPKIPFNTIKSLKTMI